MPRPLHAGPDEGDPWHILGVAPGASPAAVKQAWRQLAAEHHPDRLVAQGMPAELVHQATDKLARINDAYDRIEKLLRQRSPVGAN